MLRARSVGSDGSARARAWPTSDQVSWLFVRVSGTQENRDASTVGHADADGAMRIMPGAGGTALVGVDLVMTQEEWSAAEANAFALKCGQENACFKESVHVRHAVSAATVVEIAHEPGDASSNHAAMSKSGLATEIRALMDPVLIRGGDCAFRVYVGGDAVPGALVRGVHAKSGAVHTVRADRKGIAIINVDAPGEWRIEFDTLLEREGQWQATSSTLTFQARGKEVIGTHAAAKNAQEHGPGSGEAVTAKRSEVQP